MSEPTVTIVIPSHNHGHWLPEAVRSVAGQTYGSKQLVLVDDGSTDGTFDSVYQRMSERQPSTGADPRVVLGKLDGVRTLLVGFTWPQGPAAARNYAIRAAWDSTDVFAMLDADDAYSRPDTISRCVAYLAGNPDLGLVYTDYETLNTETGVRVRVYCEPFRREKAVKGSIVHNAGFVTKRAYELAGLYDQVLRVAEDWDLVLRISEQLLVAHLPESHLTIRVGPHNTTSQLPQEVWKECWTRVLQKAIERDQKHVR